MTVQYKIMTVPALHPDGAEEELNRFLRSVRVVSLKRELIVDHGNSFWSFVVEYLMDNKTAPASIPDAGNKRTDYKDLLSPSAVKNNRSGNKGATS